MRGLKDKVVAVTGAGGGMGGAACRRFAEEGAKIAAFDIDAVRLSELSDSIKKQGGKVHAGVVDLTDYDAVKMAVEKALAEFGRIDFLINNAGWDRMLPFVQTDPALWDRVIGINLKGVLNITHSVLPGMLERKSGRIVNIASDAGRIGSSGEAVYSACKGGVIAFAKTLARETATKGICVNSVCPGPTDTPLLKSIADETDFGRKVVGSLEAAMPMRRLGRVDDIPGILAFLCSDDASFITGQTISVSGGLTMHG